jgi:heptosyltransferase-2
MRVDSERPAYPSRIVVRGTNWVGDTVISLPAARELKRVFSSAHFTFWVPRGLETLVRATGIPDDMICFDRNDGGPLRRPFRIRKALGTGKFDMVVHFQNAFESAFTSWLARIPMRAGYPTDLRGPLLNIRVPVRQETRSKHQVFYYLAITDFLENHFQRTGSGGIGIPDCSIDLDEAALHQAGKLLASLNVDLERPIFCLCAGSANSEAKRWPGDYFAHLGDLLATNDGAQVVFLGSPDETDLIEGIISIMRVSGAVSLAGKADMITSMAVMKQSRAVISNDTGSAHLAVAAGSRVLTIFGPTSAGATAPYGRDAHIIQGEAPCAPCRHFRCPVPDHPCMRSVSPEAVQIKVRQILSGRSEG